eukprot:1676082-Prymnesium_polylepis.1
MASLSTLTRRVPSLSTTASIMWARAPARSLPHTSEFCSASLRSVSCFVARPHSNSAACSMRSAPLSPERLAATFAATLSSNASLSALTFSATAALAAAF